MKVLVVFFVRRKFFSIRGPIEEIESETIIDMGELGVVQWDSKGLHYHWRNMEHYIAKFQYIVDDIETDIEKVELGEF